MVSAGDIGWGSYREYEGPFYSGKCAFALPDNPTPIDKILAVITATEGGKYDAWNGYDSCGWTSGFIQWCERGQYSVSDMLGAVCLADWDLVEDVVYHAGTLGLYFSQNNRKGRFRFHYEDERGEVDSQDEQRQLFYLGGDGTKGSWDAASRAYAKDWAAVISSVWEQPAAQVVQREYTGSRVFLFMTSYAKSVFESMPQTELAFMLRAAYLSFAANNPKRASDSLKAAVDNSTAVAWSRDWSIEVLKKLTFHSGVSIYPHRYQKIRPVLEQLYGVDLPDLADELNTWSSKMPGVRRFMDIAHIQEALLLLGIDLGPYGVDGVLGKKTRAGLLLVEQQQRVPVSAQDGMPDRYTVDALERALEQKATSGARRNSLT